MFRSVAFLVTTEQVTWCKHAAFGSPQPGSIAIADIRKVEKIDGGFKLRAAGKVEAAFTGFTGGGLDLVGPGVSLAAAEVAGAAAAAGGAPASRSLSRFAAASALTLAWR